MTDGSVPRQGASPARVHAAFLLLCFAIAAAGAIANSYGLSDWYPDLVKPRFTPPNSLFGPVWTVLYAMIAVAGARFVLAPAGGKGLVLCAFAVQLLLNAAWSWVFFFGQAIGAAFGVIMALFIAIAATIVLGWSQDRLASLLLIPYLGWVGFATLLNGAIWKLNG